MITAQMIKEEAKKLGAGVCGVGTLDLFQNAGLQNDPKMILPKAKCIVGFGFPVPRGLYESLERGKQYYNYTSLGTAMIDSEFSEVFLFKIGKLLEDNNYDACLQRAVPNLKAKGDKTTNPEVIDTYELKYSSAVEPGKPAPDVLIDYGVAAQACGIGERGLSGSILNDKYGPYIRYAFIITDAPLECDLPMRKGLCDNCGECAKACVCNAIGSDGLDTWQCAVYYKGAHKSNPFMTEKFLQGDPRRESIINGEIRFDEQSARALYPSLRFLPHTQSGYEPCLCGKKCDVACYRHLKAKNLI